MKKKIIFVTKALWIGGIESALVNLLNHLDYDRYDVTLLVTRAELNLLEQISHNCRIVIADREKTYSFSDAYRFARLYHLTEPAQNPSLLHKMLMWATPLVKWFENRQYIRYIRTQMKKQQFDTCFDTCIIYSDVMAETAIRAIDAKHYLMYYHHGAMRRVYHDKIGYEKCDKIIAVSENLARELRKFVPSAAEKVISIHNLTDVEGIRAKAEQTSAENFDPQKFHIVSLGRAAHEKGMDLAVQACAKLVTNGFQNICWWIVGDGPALGEIRSLVAELGMKPYIRQIGMVKNPYPYIRQADLYVQPSRVESFGLTILEALILNKTVIATNTLGARELLTDRMNGILCDINADSLAETVMKFLKNDVRDRKERRNEIDQFCAKENADALRKIEEIL